MRIITISREFGSGGRELGKRLAELLGWDYYDRELINRISSKEGLDPDYVDRMLEQNNWRSVPITVCRSFSGTAYSAMGTQLLLQEKQVIDHLSAVGRDFVIVGRNADVYLRDYHPFTVFVCASMEAKISRCRARAQEGERLTDRELERSIRRIDKGRASVRELVGAGRWGDPACYHLTVNTTDWEIKTLAPSLADFALHYFERNIGQP